MHVKIDNDVRGGKHEHHTNIQAFVFLMASLWSDN